MYAGRPSRASEIRRMSAMANPFERELAAYGPDATYQPPTEPEALAYCRRLAKTHYENFSVATLLLPRRLAPHFHAIYAYCRWADDLGDETGARALALLAWWRDELLRCYAGSARHPVMVALGPTIRRFGIPKTPFLDLIKAFEQDQVVKRYETYAQLEEYCRFSANPVGRLVLYLCECFDDRRAALADDICTALQLANFWQDVARDFDIGRVYLPGDDRARFGYGDDDLAARRFTPAFRELMRFEVDRARRLFERGLALIPLMPKSVRPDIELFARGGLAILRNIEAIDYNVWRTRPAVSKREKLGLLLRVLAQKVRNSFRGDQAPT
jgi:squalene synthase HpnC